MFEQALWLAWGATSAPPTANLGVDLGSERALRILAPLADCYPTEPPGFARDPISDHWIRCLLSVPSAANGQPQDDEQTE